MHHLDNQIGAEAGVYFAFAGRQFDIGETVFTVPELSGDQFLKKRVLRSGCYRDVAAIGQGDHAQRIFQPLLRADVAGHDGNGADVEFR